MPQRNIVENIILCLLVAYTTILTTIMVIYGNQEINNHRFFRGEGSIPETGNLVMLSVFFNLVTSFIWMLVKIYTVVLKKDSDKIFGVEISTVLFEIISTIFGICAYTDNCQYSDSIPCYTIKSPVYILCLIHIHLICLGIIAFLVYILLPIKDPDDPTKVGRVVYPPPLSTHAVQVIEVHAQPSVV